MKSLVDLIIEDAMIQNDVFYNPEEEGNIGEIISSDKKEILVDKIYELMEVCVDNCDDPATEVEYFNTYKEELEMFIKQHISENLSKKIFDSCVNKGLKKVKEDLWLERPQLGLVGRFARFLKQM